MSRIFLVRHAQASFLSENYDQLSPLGETQARLLGEYWALRKMSFTRAFCGPASRHRETAALSANAYKSTGLHFPQLQVMNEFDEFQGEAVLRQALPQLIPGNNTVCELHQAFQAASSDAEKRTSFERLFEAVISMWINRELNLHDVESWEEFAARVNRGLTNIFANASKGEHVVVFTSGGPIGIAVQRALHLSPQDTLRVAWMSRNCSFTEFLFSRDRLTLSSFNSFPHLDDPALLTYR